MSVSSVVCLKTLCDKVAQIELDNQREEAERKKVSVGVNTDSAEEDSSECPTLVERDRVLDLTPTEPEPQELPVDVSQAEVYEVEVHLPNGDWSGEECSNGGSNEKFVKQHKKSRNLLIDQISDFRMERGPELLATLYEVI